MLTWEWFKLRFLSLFIEWNISQLRNNRCWKGDKEMVTAGERERERVGNDTIRGADPRKTPLAARSHLARILHAERGSDKHWPASACAVFDELYVITGYETRLVSFSPMKKEIYRSLDWIPISLLCCNRVYRSASRLRNLKSKILYDQNLITEFLLFFQIHIACDSYHTQRTSSVDAMTIALFRNKKFKQYAK